ncbi:MAG: AAA family ATPase [Mahellales bacterium]|jgi:exonuclease SbcC
MIYIKKLIIENFQSHKFTEIDFSRNLNVIVGPSDTGKTSIIRAMKWVLYNEPRGTGFIRKGENTCSVTIHFSNDYKVKRKRTASTNQYIVIDPEGKETIYEGFGNDVPVEVINIHGIRRVEFDKGISFNINIAEQMEGPFMLSQPGTLRAKAIGRLVGAHIIDATVKDIATDLYRLTQHKKEIESDIASIDDQLKQYKDLDRLEQVIKKSKGLLADIEAKQKLLQRYIDIKDNYIMAINQIKKTQDLLHDLKDLHLTESYVDDALKKVQWVKKLLTSLNKISTLDKEIAQLQNMMNKLVGLKNADGLLKTLEKVNERLRRLNLNKRTMDSIIAQIAYNLKLQKKLQAVDYLGQKLNDLETAINRLNTISDYSNKLRRLSREETRSYQLSNKLCNSADVEIMLNKIKEKKDLLETYTKIYKQYREISSACQKGTDFLDQTKKEIKDMVKRYGNIIKSLGKCPLCNSAIDDDRVRHIIDEIME